MRNATKEEREGVNDYIKSISRPIEALDMAIEALSCSESPNRSDTIYRQDAIDAIVAWTVEDRPDVEMPTDLIDRITGLPSAQPELENDSTWELFNLITSVYHGKQYYFPDDAIGEFLKEISNG